MAKSKLTVLERGIRREFPWWSPIGRKMVLNKEVTVTGRVVIHDKDKNALTIDQYATGWDVKWDVIHDFHKNLHGMVHLNTAELMAAFGIRDFCKTNDKKAARQYGVDILVSETFIRLDELLSVPGPSVKGNLISPAISLHLTDEIIQAVADMIKECK